MPAWPLAGRRDALLGRQSSPYTAAAVAYFAAMAVQPDATRKGLIDALIVGLIADGVWAKLDWLVLLASHTSQASLLNAKAPAKTMLAVSAPTFTADRGWAGDAVAAHLSFGEVLNAAGNQFAQDSATIGSWCNQQTGASGIKYHFGNTSTSNPSARITTRDDGIEGFKLNGASLSAVSSVSRTGHRTATRLTSGAPFFYKNGAQTANPADTTTGVTAGIPTVLRDGSVYTADRVAAVYFGAGMSGTDAVNIHGRLNTYFTPIGAN